MSAEVVWIPPGVGRHTEEQLAEWKALRRVQGAEVTVAHGNYVAQGRSGQPFGPLRGDLAGALDRLALAGCVALGQPDSDGHRLVSTTVTGEIHYAELFCTWWLR